MRFIIGFIFYGIIFYLIWLFFPEAFKTLVHWTEVVVNFVKEYALLIWDKIFAATSSAKPPG